MDEVRTIVIGAGVVGLAIARALARGGDEVLILEAEEAFGLHTSSRNSGVIHGGIYYPKGSLKARLCVEGKAMLYDFCATRAVDYANCGKLIVAVTEDHQARLAGLVDRAAGNGVDDLRLLSAAEAQAMEPALACKGAVWSPSTGIVDAVGLMRALLGEAESAGAMLAYGARVDGVRISDGFEVSAAGMQIKCRRLINAAGLGAWDVARGMIGLDPAHVPVQYFDRGNWYACGGKMPFERLIYPVPDDDTLGVHYVRDLGGGFRFGPDLEPLDRAEVDYAPSADRGADFETSVRRWWPDVPTGAMRFDGCGIRPRSYRNGVGMVDFNLSGPRDHGVAGLVNLFGIESPGLTAALALGAEVRGWLRGKSPI